MGPPPAQTMRIAMLGHFSTPVPEFNALIHQHFVTKKDHIRTQIEEWVADMEAAPRPFMGHESLHELAVSCCCHGAVSTLVFGAVAAATCRPLFSGGVPLGLGDTIPTIGTQHADMRPPHPPHHPRSLAPSPAQFPTLPAFVKVAEQMTKLLDSFKEAESVTLD